MAFGIAAAACGGSTDDAAEGGNTETDTTDAPADDSPATTAEVVAVEPDAPADEIATDFGVSDKTIRIGINADLSGPFAPLVSDMVEAQKVYWEALNEAGGIEGYTIETVVLDSGYATDVGISNYQELAQESDDGVLMISEQTGSPINNAIAEDAIDDNMLIIPLSWASLWPDPVVGEAVLEKGTTYCIEAMNGVAWLKAKVESEGKEPKLAIIGRPGEYGEDGSTGAANAAAELGVEVVYDGTGAVAGEDRTAIISELVSSGATMVWLTLTPGETIEVFAGSVGQGFDAVWSGNSPSFNANAFLGSDFAAKFDEFYYHSTYNVPWDADGIPEMDIMKAELAARRPDLTISDVFPAGWIEGIIVENVIRQAMANGDMTRAGMMQASKEVSVDMRGLGPDQSWSGDYNSDVVRESYIYDVDASIYNPVTTSGDDGTGSLGTVILEGPYISDLVANSTFDGPCIG